MMRWRSTTKAFVAIAFALVLATCRSGSALRDSDDESSAPPVSTMTMTVSAAKATIAPVHRELHLLGTTVASHHLQLRAPAAGRVLGFNLQNGDHVRRGEVVARVVNREIEAALNGLAVAQRLDPKEGPALAKSVTRYSHGSGIPVIAHEEGTVSQVLVSSGQMVNDMDPLAELIDPNSLYVEAAVPVENLSSIRPGMGATVTCLMNPDATRPGRIAAFSPNVSPNGATSSVRIEFGAGCGIAQAGAPVEATVTLISVPNAIVIPVSALFADSDGRNHVFVIGPDGRAHRTAVTAGIRNGDAIQIISGVSAGDRVITSGGYALADGLKVTVAPQ
jgi:multidrug efflux pump subunit AcrA (membrane-fusion protein)